MKQKLTRIGTRGSALALAQTELVVSAIKAKYPGAVIEKVIISTKGDRETDKPVSSFGDKGVFITEIEEALSNADLFLSEEHLSQPAPSLPLYPHLLPVRRGGSGKIRGNQRKLVNSPPDSALQSLPQRRL